MKTYKVLKKVSYQDKAGKIFEFNVNSQITSKDLLNEKQEKGFVKDGFIENVEKRGRKKNEPE